MSLSHDFHDFWNYESFSTKFYVSYLEDCKVVIVLLHSVILAFLISIENFYMVENKTNALLSSSNNQLRIPNFCNEFFFIWLFEYLYQVEVLNYYHNTPKNANITLYIKKIKTLCNTLNWGNWGNWNSGFIELVVLRIPNFNFPNLRCCKVFLSF